MNPVRTLNSWLGRPTKHPRRGLVVERLEDRFTPTVSDKILAQPINLDALPTTQDLIARTNSANPLNDLANAVSHLGLGNIVDVAGSSLVTDKILQIHLKDGVVPKNAAVTLMATGLYSFVSPNYVYATSDLREAIPNDPQYATQYPHGIIDSPRAWDTTVGSPSVTIAILDDGLDINHPDLLANVWTNFDEIAGDGVDNDGNGFIDDKRGWDFVSNSNRVTPDDPTLDPHGTQIAGILAGRINNNVGIAGVAGGSRIMPIKVVGSGPTSSLTLIRAVDYAIDNGAKIINSSINIDPFLQDPSFKAAVTRAYDAGVLWINSAGNLNLQDPARASLTEMLIVGATDRLDAKTNYSNYGWGLDLSAPGGSSSDPVATTIPGGYGTAWGTSVAAPLVAGTAALLWSANPTWSRDQVVSAILANTDSLDGSAPNFIDKLGTGRLDAGESVSGGEFVTRFGRLYEMPSPGEDAPPGFDSFRLRLQGNLDAETVMIHNFELRWAGLDNIFDNGNDHVVPLSLADGYQFGTNSLDFTLGETLDRGLYRFTAKSGGLRDPFGTAIDGDGDGIAGGNLVRFFGNPIHAQGVITGDIDNNGPSPGAPGIAGIGVFPDLNNNGQWDTASFPSTVAPLAIADNDADHPAIISIPVSGFTRPVNYISVRVLLTHPAPADLIITLVAPNGMKITLLRNRPLPADVPADSRLFEFADEIVESITASTGLVTYRLKPDEALSSLYGGSANGIWQVIVADTTPGDSGTLISADLTIGGEALAITNANGEWTIGNLPAEPVTIRILPTGGWTVIGNEKEDGFPIDSDRNISVVVNATIAREAGILGRVHDSSEGVGGFIVFLDSDNDGTLDAGETSAVSDEHGVYAFPGLAAGAYKVRIVAQPGYSVPMPVLTVVLTPAMPLSAGRDFQVVRDTGPVEVAIPAVSPELRTTEVGTIAFTLSEPVDGLELGDLKLTRDGVEISLADATLLGSGTAFTLIALDELTRIDGTYTLTILAPGPVGDPSRTPLPSTTTWTLDTTPPTATVTPAVGPKGVVDRVALQFSTPVNGLDITDFVLRQAGVEIPLATVSLTATAGGFTLSNLSTVAGAAGTYTLELKAGAVTDSAGNPLAGSTVTTWTVPPQRVRFTAVGAGEGSIPTVVVHDVDGKLIRTITPFDVTFTSGVRVATGDVNGDLVDDIIVAPGRGSGPRVRVYDGKTGLVINDFFALEPNFRGGLMVAAGDVTGDGVAEIVITPDKGGGPRVRVLDGMTAKTVADFFGIEDVTFRGGARAALGDVTGDGRMDVIVSAGTGGGPRVAAFDGISVAAGNPTKPFGDFLAFEAGLRNGATIAAVDLDGDGHAEIIAAAGDGGGPRLTAFSGASLMVGQYVKLSDFFVGNLDSRGGLRLAVEDLNDDGVMELLVGPGSGVGSRIRVYNAAGLIGVHNPLREFDPFGGFLGGVFLG